MRLRRSALLAVVCLGTAAAPAMAETTVLTTARQTELSAGSGVLLYSAYDAQAKNYRLVQRIDGLTTPVPVAPSPRPFQADVGPTTSGHAFYVYSRCEDTAGSCDLYVFNPKTGVEQRSKASDGKHDDILPTYWKGRLAFVRDYGTTNKPKQIVYNRPNGNTSRSERLPGLPSKRCDKGECIDPAGRFEAIELYGDQLAQTAFSQDVSVFPTNAKAGHGPKFETFREDGVELRLVDRGLTRSRRLARSGQGEGGQDFSGVAFDRGRLYAGFTCRSCARLKAGIYRYAYADDKWAFAKESSNVATYDLAVGDGTFYRERDNVVPGVISRCYAGGDNGEGSPPDCKVDRSTDPGFQPIPAPGAGNGQSSAGARPSTVISANGEIFTAHEQSRGRVRVPTPRTFTRLSVNGARTARYRVAVSPMCDATLIASVRGVATTDSQKKQIQRALGHGAGDLAAGTAAAGPWRMTVEGAQADEHRALYGILPARVANHRYAQLRLLGNTVGACTDAQVHSKAFATAVTRYFSGARFEVTVQRT